MHSTDIKKKTKTTTDHTNFKKAKAQARRIIKQQKSESWKHFVNNLNHYIHITEARKKIRMIKGILLNETPHNHSKKETKYLFHLLKKQKLLQTYSKKPAVIIIFPLVRNFKNKNITGNPIVFTSDDSQITNIPFDIQKIYVFRIKCNSEEKRPTETYGTVKPILNYTELKRHYLSVILSPLCPRRERTMLWSKTRIY